MVARGVGPTPGGSRGPRVERGKQQTRLLTHGVVVEVVIDHCVGVGSCVSRWDAERAGRVTGDVRNTEAVERALAQHALVHEAGPRVAGNRGVVGHREDQGSVYIATNVRAVVVQRDVDRRVSSQNRTQIESIHPDRGRVLTVCAEANVAVVRPHEADVAAGADAVKDADIEVDAGLRHVSRRKRDVLSAPVAIGSRIEEAPGHVSCGGALGLDSPAPPLNRPLAQRCGGNGAVAGPAFIVNAARWASAGGDGQEAIHPWSSLRSPDADCRRIRGGARAGNRERDRRAARQVGDIGAGRAGSNREGSERRSRVERRSDRV